MSALAFWSAPMIWEEASTVAEVIKLVRRAKHKFVWVHVRGSEQSLALSKRVVLDALRFKNSDDSLMARHYIADGDERSLVGTVWLGAVI